MKNSVSRISFDEIKKNKEKYAMEFSEGNLVLENCLLLLWDNNIYTKGCCIGHDEKNPYIALDLMSNLSIINKIINNIDKNNIRISFTCDKNNKNVVFKSIDINDLSIFNKVINSIYNNTSKNMYEKEIQKVLNMKDDYYNLVHYYKDNKLIKKIVCTNNLEEIKKLQKKYKYIILNEKNKLYQFDIK